MVDVDWEILKVEDGGEASVNVSISYTIDGDTQGLMMGINKDCMANGLYKQIISDYLSKIATASTVTPADYIGKTFKGKVEQQE